MTKQMFLFFCLCVQSLYADQVIWKGEVTSDGATTPLIPLTLRERYKIKVAGSVNLGKWVQAGQKLANDACFEYNKMQSLTKHEFLRNSHDISVCDGTYHSDHEYESQPFIAKKNRIFFWIDDTDYEDNSGSFQVEIIQITRDTM